MPDKLWGVIVSDVVGSSRTRNLRAVLNARLRLVTAAHFKEERIRLPYAVTAGDEFQTVAADLRQIPGILFDLRRRMRPLQLRIGIGIGRISGPLRAPVNQLGGQAFEFARLAIGETKEGRLEIVQSLRSDINNISLPLLGPHLLDNGMCVVT